MRRVNPVTLCRARSRFDTLSIARRSVISTRPLSTSTTRHYPRSGPFCARHQSSDAAAAAPAKPDTESTTPDVEEHFVDDAGEGSSNDSFASHVTSLTTPVPNDQPLPEELKTLYHHLLVSFLPHNQPHQAASASSSKLARPPPDGKWTTLHLDGLEEPSSPAPVVPESVIALVNPFEGGRWYTEEAVTRVASQLDADVLKFDLALGLGIHGPASPLGREGSSAPPLSQSSNPLIQEQPKPSFPPQPMSHPFLPTDPENIDENDDDHEHGRNSAIIMTPMSAQMPFPLPGMPNADQMSQGSVRDDWVGFFESWINRAEVETEGGEVDRRRIILLESIEGMSSTFDEWWPSLVEAVRRRRRVEVATGDSGDHKSLLPTYKLGRPTTIVFSSSPSMLLPHTSAPSASREEAEAAASQVAPFFQEIADRFGGTVETKVENAESGPLWWGSEEVDDVGRKERNAKRLAALVDESKGSSSLMPTLGAKPKPARPRHPLLDMLAGGNNSRQDDSKQPEGLIRKTLPIIPAERNHTLEMLERIRTRSLLSAALLSKAVNDLGGDLVDPVSAMTRVKVEPTRVDRAGKRKGEDKVLRYYRIDDPTDPNLSKLSRGENYRIVREGWHNAVRSWPKVRQLAAAVLGQKLSQDDKQPRVTWLNVLAACEVEKTETEKLSERIRGYIPKSKTVRHTTKTGPSTAQEPAIDSVVAKVKRAKDLSQHEKRLLGSIVDTSKLASTSFNDVHLPFKTIDAIRTIISLPLLFPEAFQGGVLKDHATTGALLFGPPGTGKTLLARAVANESGARMLAIQPSDVNDKYFGEGEKLVKAVFSLARRLSPCVVFLDEVDALFGARSARGAGMGSKAHDQLLTEFMQEMDGLSSAEINKDKRIVVIGATNRPFDLDDAVLRRLPRRLLVDLPGPEDRKAILTILLKREKLGGDVDLERLVKDTDGFSGSDLKHLCVSAALAAVKDSVRVPWNQLDSTAVLGGPKTVVPEPTPSSGRSTNLIIEDPANDKPELVTLPSASLDLSDPRAQVPPATPDGLPPSDTSGFSEDSASTSPNDSTEQATAGAPSDEVGADKPNTEDKEPPRVLPRVLLKRHFDVALTEIRPSSSEEGSLPELRKVSVAMRSAKNLADVKWADQFGEGGTQKGRKKGFGKGFGFGDLASRSNRDKGYGKVVQDD